MSTAAGASGARSTPAFKTRCLRHETLPWNPTRSTWRFGIHPRWELDLSSKCAEVVLPSPHEKFKNPGRKYSQASEKKRRPWKKKLTYLLKIHGTGRCWMFFSKWFPFLGDFRGTGFLSFSAWMARARAVSTASGVAVHTKNADHGSGKNVSFFSQFQPFSMDVWLFPTISHVEIWNHPIETTIKNQHPIVKTPPFCFQIRSNFCQKNSLDHRFETLCLFKIGVLNTFPYENLPKTTWRNSCPQNAGLLGTLRLGCLGIHILTEHLERSQKNSENRRPKPLNLPIDFRQVTEVYTE